MKTDTGHLTTFARRAACSALVLFLAALPVHAQLFIDTFDAEDTVGPGDDTALHDEFNVGGTILGKERDTAINDDGNFPSATATFGSGQVVLHDTEGNQDFDFIYDFNDNDAGTLDYDGLYMVSTPFTSGVDLTNGNTYDRFKLLVSNVTGSYNVRVSILMSSFNSATVSLNNLTSGGTIQLLFSGLSGNVDPDNVGAIRLRIELTSFNSSLTLEEFGTADAGTALPVELTGFTATADGPDVLLRWHTATETNNAGFSVERRAESRERWETLGFVDGHGTTTAPQAYRHRLENLAPGTYRFRLKQVDFDGTFAYSPEVEMTVEVAEAYAFSAAYPNPFNPQTAFTLAVQQRQRVEVAVYNMLGQRVALLHAGLLEASQAHRFAFAAGSLPSGLYMIRAEGERFTTTRRVTLAK